MDCSFFLVSTSIDSNLPSLEFLHYIVSHTVSAGVKDNLHAFSVSGIDDYRSL